ncbi:hypothetical protein [Stenomitos frigidus]|uniref:Uncharacterized protein n=1 Tax=Stenomitos frigidus ULC18 TaxID=2107698 RepID=A0A2T1DWI4_9CYAN|nr:hypothetical protein [Stenomitos frigidus]PSB24858.1 hypothetical protein C7B82_26030 [Stenomitos frigidus ULC18]
MVQDFTAFRKISFQTVDVEVALAEIEYQYLRFVCEATLRNSDEVLREQIRNLHIPGLPSFDDWRKQEATPVRGILVPSIETNTIPTTAIASQESVAPVVEPAVAPSTKPSSDRKPADAPTAKATQAAPSGSVTSALLQVLAEPASAKLTSREVIEQQHEKLSALLKEGQSMDELATLLTSNGAKISASTLRNYLSAARRKAKTSNANNAGKPARAKNDPAAKKVTGERSTDNAVPASKPSVEAAPVVISQPSTAEATDAPPVPTKPKRGRPKAAAKAKLEHETSVTATRKPKTQAPALKKRKGSR